MVIGMTTKRFRPFSRLIAIASAASSPTMDRQAQAFSPRSPHYSVLCKLMPGQLVRMDVEAAKEDLRIRTLGPIGYDFGRLLYLASVRDYSTGEYHHHGLARSFLNLPRVRLLPRATRSLLSPRGLPAEIVCSPGRALHAVRSS